MKPAVDHSFESLNSEVIHFLLSVVFRMLKVFLSYGRLAEYDDLHSTATRNDLQVCVVDIKSHTFCIRFM